MPTIAEAAAEVADLVRLICSKPGDPFCSALHLPSLEGGEGSEFNGVCINSCVNAVRGELIRVYVNRNDPPSSAGEFSVILGRLLSPGIEGIGQVIVVRDETLNCLVVRGVEPN